MNGKIAAIIGVLAFAVLFLGTQAFAARMGSRSSGDPWALIRPDVPEMYAYTPEAPCLAFCGAEAAAGVYGYYGNGLPFSFSKITIPKPTMKAPSPSERPDIPEMNQGREVPTWY